MHLAGVRCCPTTRERSPGKQSSAPIVAEPFPRGAAHLPRCLPPPPTTHPNNMMGHRIQGHASAMILNQRCLHICAPTARLANPFERRHKTEGPTNSRKSHIQATASLIQSAQRKACIGEPKALGSEPRRKSLSHALASRYSANPTPTQTTPTQSLVCAPQALTAPSAKDE